MSFELTAAVLAAAALHAAWNALVKSSPDRLVELGLLNLAAGLLAAAALPAVGFPGWDALPYLVGSLLFHCGYYVFLLLSYSAGGLSLVYPIALVAALRETSVVLAAIIGAVFLGEPFGRGRILASIGVALGIVVLRLAS